MHIYIFKELVEVREFFGLVRESRGKVREFHFSNSVDTLSRLTLLSPILTQDSPRYPYQ